MSVYLIGIGGTGSKIVESFIHLSATGAISEDEKVNIFFVDADQANGNGTRTSNLKDTYSRIRSIPSINQFKTDVRYAQNRERKEIKRWDIIEENKNTLEELFIGDFNTNSSTAELLKVLYTKEELQESLYKGFKGHPNIGSLVIAKNLDFDSEPWCYLFGDQGTVSNELNNQTVKIILCGSIFGGTGAAGIPTISKLLHDKYEKEDNVSVNCVLMLPYFDFLSENTKEMKATADKFIENTKYALDYYHNESYYDYFQSLYVIGDDISPSCDNSAIGGMEQINQSFLPEMIASLGIRDCINGKEEDPKVVYTKREFEDGNKWSLLANDVDVKNRLLHTLVYSLHYTNVYYPRLDAFIKQRSIPTHESWAINFFVKRGIDIFNENSVEHLDDMNNFCTSYIRWISEIFGKDFKYDLIDSSLFKEDEKIMKIKKMKNIDAISNPKLSKSIRYDKIFKKMNSYKLVTDSHKEIGEFFNVLYDFCDID